MKKLVIAMLLGVLVPAGAEELPFPRGSTSQTHDGLVYQLVLPEGELEEKDEWSMVVILHGYGGTEAGMAGALQSLASKGFVICAPKSAGDGWTDPDLVKVRALTTHLLEVLPVGEGRLHGAGFSNGGWNLAAVAFDENLPFVSACWIAAGYKGGKIPKDAVKRMGAIALVGSEDPNRSSAEQTVSLLDEKVRSVECRVQDGLGHEFPDELMPYYFFWLEAMEGRYLPEDDMCFDWLDDLEAAKEQMASEKRAGFVYFYSVDDAGTPEADLVQRTVMFNRLVRRFGSQILAIKLPRAENEEAFASYRLKKTPAIVVLSPKGKKLKALQGKIDPRALAKVLRAVAPDHSMPK